MIGDDDCVSSCGGSAMIFLNLNASCHFSFGTPWMWLAYDSVVSPSPSSLSRIGLLSSGNNSVDESDFGLAFGVVAT